MDFSLQNGATASASQYIQFNQIFTEGDLPQGQSISALVGSQIVPLQMDVLSRYDDGSVKSAILTMAAPAVAAGATVQGILVASGASSGTAIATNAALAQGYDLAVNMNISGFGATTINAAQQLAAHLASGDIEVLRQGALATEIRFDVAVTRALRVTFDVVTYADGSVSTTVGFNNDSAMGATGGSILFSSLSIVEGGVTRFSKTNLTQYQFQDWTQEVTQDNSAKQTLNVKHDIDYLEQTGAIPNYDLTATVSAAPAVPSSWTNVLGVNGLFQYMPATGGRPDIGPTTEANARWLITQDASAATYALAQDQAAGSIPWHYYEAAKGHYLSVADYPNLWIDPRGSVQPKQIDGGQSGWTTDRAHNPDLSYVAWLLTGDRYHLDMLNAQASWSIANAWNDPRQNGRGIVANSAEEVRSQAWALRTVQEAAYANPDGSYEKAYFTQIANNNWAYLRGMTVTLSATQGQVHGYFEGVYRDGLAPWQQDFFASTTALAALQGNEDARAVLKWEANFLSGRFLSPDINPYNGFDYSLNVYGSNGNALTSWAAVATATNAAGNYATGPSAGYWAELAAMSNANIITVFAGGEDPTDHRVAADAMRAYGWILGSGMPDLRTDLQYQIVPRMADGTQVGVTEMRVVAPTAQNTTLTFTGNNVFAYDKGVGRTTLVGTAGADVMIDNSTAGGDRLQGGTGDDYLIGGTGTNVFAPGDGQDYALIRGGAARVEVNAQSPGRIEIEGFRSGTDLIVLAGTTSLASVLASAQSDGFGGTLLTVSSTRTIRLNGLAPSSINAGMFDASGTSGSGGQSDIIQGTSGADTLVGTAGGETLLGLGGDDTLYGGAGNDRLDGAVGNDTLDGGDGDDTFVGGAGNDVIFGGPGNDLAVVSGNWNAYTITSSGGTLTLVGADGTDRVSGVEQVQFANGTFAASAIVNHAPTANADTNGSDTVRKGGVGDVTGDPSAAGNVLTNDSDVDAPLGDSLSLTAVSSVSTGANGTLGSALTGKYGSLTLNTNGTWTYTLNNADPDTQALTAGSTAQDVFAYTVRDTAGATATAQLTITVSGANNAPGNNAPVAVADTNAGDAVSESGVNPGNTAFAGDASATGNVLTNDTDVDAGDTRTVTTTGSFTGTYGTLSLAANGTWTYTLNNADADTQALAQGQSVADVFNYTMRDTAGATASSTLTVTITGTNDAPVAVADTNGSDAVSESGVNPGNTAFAGDASATGNVLTNDTDVDAGDTKTVTTTGSFTGTYGTLSLAANGTWTYTLNNADADTQALAQGQSVNDVFNYTMRDTAGATASSTLSITITGTNDANTAPGTTLHVGAGQTYATLAAAVAASHDGDVIAVQAGTYVNDFATISKDITIVGVGGMANFVATVAPPNGKGILVTQSDVTIQNLSFSGAAVADGNGAGIRYEGGNLVVIDSYFHDNQDGILAAANPTGTIRITGSEFAHNGAGDGQSHNIYVNNIASLVIDDSYFHDAVVGHEIKSRAQSTTITNSRIYDNNGTASYSIDLPNGGVANIHDNVIQQGVNSQNPVIISYSAEGAAYAGSSLTIADNVVVNDLTGSPSVRLLNNYSTVTAIISGEDVYGLTASQIASGPASISGTTSLSTRPTLDTSAPWLDGGTGTNDAPVAVADSNGSDAVSEAGVNPGNTAFAGDSSATGNVLANDTDVDAGDTRTVTTTGSFTGTYGTLSLAANGTWTYTLNNTDADTQALTQGQSVADVFNYTMRDTAGATSSSTLSVTITGTNDAPVAVADTNAGDAVIEAGVNPGNTPFAGDASATGNVLTNDTDVDAGDTKTVTTTGTFTGTYGSLSLAANGTWTYTLNNADPDTQALKQGQSVADVFNYTMRDTAGATSSSTLSVTITGTNDAPVAVADTNGSDAVSEAGVTSPGNTPFAGDASATGNVLTNDTDVDAGDTKTVTTTGTFTGTYGSLSLAANGTWTYTLNNADADTQALAQGQSVADVFNYTMRDTAGATSSSTLSITITGTNDAPANNAPVAVADTNGSNAVSESGVNPGNTAFAGDASATGNVLTNDTDVDAGDTKTVTTTGTFTGTYGSLSLAANGTWTYTLNNADADTQALAQGQSVADVFNYTMRDTAGATSSSTLSVTITGTNDAPVAVADTNGSDAVSESGVNPGNTAFAGDASATGNVLTNDTDVDAGDTRTVTTTGTFTGTYGSLSLAANGTWTYTLNNADPDTQALKQGQSVADVFNYTMRDTAGATSSSTLSVTITGTNDAPVAVADTNGSNAVSESGVNPGNTAFAGDASATGNVLTNDTDVDAGDTKTVTTTGTFTGTYGSLSLAANGTWTYTLNNADAGTQALAQGQSVADVFNYTMRDTAGATSSSTLSVTITGTNDAPVAVADTNGSDAVSEAGVNPGNTPFAGDASATGNVLTNDTDVDAGDTKTVTTTGTFTGTYGSLSLAANGTWTYTLNNADPDTQALKQGQSVADVFNYTMRDTAGATASSTLSITVTGTNDAPVAVADDVSAQQDTPITYAASTLLGNDADVDAGSTLTISSVTSGTGGTVSLNGNGDVVFTPIDGFKGTATFTYTVSDGSATSAPIGVTVQVVGREIIEAAGTTDLSMGAGRYFLETSSTPDATLKYLGAEFIAGQTGAWAPIGAEAATGGGYDVVFRFGAADQYTVWHTDNNGNYASSLLGVVSGTDYTLQLLETRFDQDLNNDGQIGLALTEIEAHGATALETGASRFFLQDGGSLGFFQASGPLGFFQDGGPLGRTLKYGGTDFIAGQSGAWTPIAAEAASGGYDVVFKNGTANQYTAWHTDSSGNYASSLFGVVSGSTYALQHLESQFSQDLNNDGTIGPITSAIETRGATSLLAEADEYFFQNGGTPGPSLKYLGADFIAGQSGAWAPIAAEAANGGYDVVFKSGSADQYTVWHTDSSGNYTSSLTGIVSGSTYALQHLEDIFSQDLNNDGTTGAITSTIETHGATSLVAQADEFFFEAGSTLGPSLKYGGADYVAGQAGAWTPIAAEAVSGGYDVAFKNGTSDQYTVWRTDSSGNYTSSLTGVVSGTDYTLQKLEDIFAQDVNNDGHIGVALTLIEAHGSTALETGANHFFFETGGTLGPSLKLNGADFIAGQSGAWTPIAAEAASGGGYDVVFKAGSGNQYTVWHTDNNGDYASSLTGVVAGNNSTLRALETRFDQDLNGNGFIG